MVSHPNRSKKNPKPGRNPSPEEIYNARVAAGLTQSGAADLVYSPVVTWKSWESGLYRMAPATWELFQIKTKSLQNKGENTSPRGIRVTKYEKKIRDWAAIQESKGMTVVITQPTDEAPVWMGRAYKDEDLSTPDATAK